MVRARPAAGITAGIILIFTFRTAVATGTAAPEVFAPGIISGPEHDTAPAFTPDGRTVYFSRSDGNRSTLLVSHLRRAGWTEPQTAPFSIRTEYILWNRWAMILLIVLLTMEWVVRKFNGLS